MKTVNIVLCAINLFFCLSNAVVHRGEARRAYIMGFLGWLIALINL